jgi:hypothetical protein
MFNNKKKHKKIKLGGREVTSTSSPLSFTLINTIIYNKIKFKKIFFV